MENWSRNDLINLINKYTNLKKNKKGLKEEDENEIIDLLVVCRQGLEKVKMEIQMDINVKVEVEPKNEAVNGVMEEVQKEKEIQKQKQIQRRIKIQKQKEMEERKFFLVNYVNILKLLIFFIPHNSSIQNKITEREIYKILITERNWKRVKYKEQYEEYEQYEESEQNEEYEQNEKYEPYREMKQPKELKEKDTTDKSLKVKENNDDTWEEVEKYEIIFLINLITHNERNDKVFQHVYKDYMFYIILRKHNKDNIFMLLSNWILNKKTYNILCEQKDVAFFLFLAMFDSLKGIATSTNICSYFYIFIENTLKHESRLFLHIFENLQSLYGNFDEYAKEIQEKFPFLVTSDNWKILNKNRNNKRYIFKYVVFMFRLLIEVLYNILEEKEMENEKGNGKEKEQIQHFKKLYRFILEEVKNNLIYVREITYFDNFENNQIDVYYKNLLFMDMFTFYTKQWNLEIFKIFLFISNIFNEYFKELDNWNPEEKKSFIDVVFMYLDTLLKMRSQHLIKKEKMLYHNFVYNRYIISIVTNFSFDSDVAQYIKQKNGINLLTKFMYIDEKDPYLSEYSVLAIKNIKENEI